MNGIKTIKGIYRSRNGLLLGVCRGLAEYFNLSVGGVRIITLIAFIFTGFWPVGMIYLILALLMKPAPVVAFQNSEDAEFYDSYTESRANAAGRIKRTYENLERRLRRLEDVVTSPSFQWDKKAGN